MKYTFSLWSSRCSVLAAVVAASGMVACGGANESDDPSVKDHDHHSVADNSDDIQALTSEVGPGSKGAAVAAVYDHLHQYGYLPNAKLEAAYPHWAPVVDVDIADPTAYDADLEEAVRAYQGHMDLAVTGVVDAATLAMMRQPRCGHPENELARLDPAEKFALTGDIWTKDNIVYKIMAGTADVTDESLKTAQGAGDWNNNSRANVTSTTGATFDIEVRWFNRGSPPAGWSDFSQASTLAYANKTRVAFNDLHNWNYVAGNASTFDVRTVFIHELGHSLGLHHSSFSSAVMFPTIPGGATKGPSGDDLTGIKLRFLDTPTVFTGATLKDVAWGGVGVSSIHGITTGNAVVRHNGGSSWTTVPGMSATNVAVDSAGKPWVVKTDTTIWFQDASNTWIQAVGNAREIAVNNANQLWAVDVAVDANGNSALWKWNPSLFAWELSDGIGKRIAIDSNNRIWVVQGNGSIWRRTTSSGATGSWQSMAGCAKDIAAGPSLTVWAVNCTVVSGTNNQVMVWNEQSGGGAPARAEWIVQPLMSGTRLAINYNQRPLVVQSGGGLQYGL